MRPLLQVAQPNRAPRFGEAFKEIQRRTRRYANCALVTVCAILFASLGNSRSAAVESHAPLSESIERVLQEEKLVGATWALVTPASTQLGAAGFNDMARGVRMSPDDRVHVGSVAKTLIATGILQLVTRGLLDLDAPISSYLAEIRFENPWHLERPVRVRHLLDHTSGLDDVRLWQVFSMRAVPDAPLRSALPNAGTNLAVRYRPGDRFSYSNTGYLLLGMLIEKVVGQRYESWLDAELLAPLGMTRSTFAFTSQIGSRADLTLAMGHFDPKTPQHATPIHVRPAGQFTTTAADMARFAKFLMSDGRVNGRTVVSGDLLRGMATPTTTEAASAGLKMGHALGLVRRDRHGMTGHCHLGNIGTFRSTICIYPEQEKAFFAAFNTDPEDAKFDRVDQLLIDALQLSPVLAVPAAQPSFDPSSWDGWYRLRPVRFEQFAYLDELFGLARIESRHGQLHLKPLFGTERILTPVGGLLLRDRGRVEASHVVAKTADRRPIVSDGLRTYEQVDLAGSLLLWTSAIVGLLGLLYLLIAGLMRNVVALRARTLRFGPVGWVSVYLAALSLAPVLFLTQSFLAVGDPTPANLTIAVLSGGLPLALIVAAVLVWRRRIDCRTAKMDLIAIGGLLQWCAVLASWGLLPLALWR